MKFPRFLLAGAVLCAGPLMAQQDAPAVNADAILRDLDQIEQQQKQAVQTARITAISQLKTAAASATAATDLFENAVKATQFEGVKGQGSAFTDWKSSKTPTFRTKEFQTALLLHLKYLVLSLERKGSDKPEIFVAPSLDFAVEIAGVDEMYLKQAQLIKGGGKEEDVGPQREAAKLKDELLNKPLSDSIFVKWLRLGSWLPKGEDWELSPGNISGILEKNVRPVWRKAKNPRLLETWLFEMKVLGDRVTFGRLDYQAGEFNTVARPKLQFAMANDMVEIGQTNRGTTEIYKMIKENPQHPDFAKWVQRLRELLKPSEPAADPSPATGTSPQ